MQARVLAEDLEFVVAEPGDLLEVLRGILDRQFESVGMFNEPDRVVGQVDDAVADGAQLSGHASSAPQRGFVECVEVPVSTESFRVVYQQFDQSAYELVHAYSASARDGSG